MALILSVGAAHSVEARVVRFVVERTRPFHGGQMLQIVRYWRSTIPTTTLPAPVPAKGLALPRDDGIRLYQHERLSGLDE
jgi:hypothetical protein